jgi:mannose/cellobiose epimerase-like protein (N-acyl-D-glucosamine 2-epimerase family)
VTFDLGTDDHIAWLKSQTSSLLSFYERSADFRRGGFDELSSLGEPMGAPKPLFLTARMTYGYALGHVLGHPGSARLVEHGLRALRTSFHDDADGGWFATLGANGTTIEDSAKHTYGHAFVLLAASAASQAGFDSDDLIAEASAMFDRYLYEPSHHLCNDTWDRHWTHCDDYRGMNANMHAVEASLGAYSATSNPTFLERAQAISARMIAFARSSDWRIPEHFTTDWMPLPDFNVDNPGDQFKPYGSTPGHGIEWSRLLLQLRLAAGDEPESGTLPDAAQRLFARAVGDGWDREQHGFAYTVDWDGHPVARQRLHWPLAEAIGAARYLYAATNNRAYADWYQQFWELADSDYIDHNFGSWWHELDTDGHPATTIWAGKGDLYHSLQATLFGQLAVTPTIIGLLAAG